MDDDFSMFYYDEHFGPALEVRKVPEASFLKFRHRLPDQLLEYWREYGWSGYGNGLFWVVDPDRYAPVVEAWLEGTPFRDADVYHVMALGAFGEIFLWGEQTGPSLSIESPWGMLFPTEVDKRIAEGEKDLVTRIFFSGKSKDVLDFEDDSEKFLFDRAVKKLGVLNTGQIYGFVPALSIGGVNRLEHLQKVDAVAHLVMLAQMTEKRIMRDIVGEAKAAGAFDQLLSDYIPKK